MIARIKRLESIKPPINKYEELQGALKLLSNDDLKNIIENEIVPETIFKLIKKN